MLTRKQKSKAERMYRWLGSSVASDVSTQDQYGASENIITQTVNAIVQTEMEERNLSRADMARRLEISPVTVTKALNNRQRDWRITTISDWADAMNCDLHIEFRSRKKEK